MISRLGPRLQAIFLAVALCQRYAPALMTADAAPTLDVAAQAFQPGKARFVKPSKTDDVRGGNAIAKHAAAALRSERAQVDAQCAPPHWRSMWTG